KALDEVSQLLGEYLDGAGAEWRGGGAGGGQGRGGPAAPPGRPQAAGADARADGAERRKVRDALAALQRSLERAGTYLDRATEVAVAAKRRVPQSGGPAKIG